MDEGIFHTEYLKKLQADANEYCAKNNLPQVSVEMSYSEHGAFFNAKQRKIVISEYSLSFNEGEDDLVHELRHYKLDCKTKGLATIFGDTDNIFFSLIPQAGGYLLNINALNYFGSSLWSLFFLVEAHAEWQNHKKRVAFYAGVGAIPWIVNAFTGKL